MNRAILILLMGLGVLGGMASRATADEWDQKTIFTFSGPVEVPGQVLKAGTYVFKLADSSPERSIVQVFSKDETHLYATFVAIPDVRLQPRGNPIITFDEAPAGSGSGAGVVLSWRELRASICISEAEGGRVGESKQHSGAIHACRAWREPWETCHGRESPSDGCLARSSPESPEAQRGRS